MGEAAFNVPIQKVCRYLQVITSEMRHKIFVGMLTDKVILPIRAPLLHLSVQMQPKETEKSGTILLPETKKEGNCISIIQYSKFSSPYDQPLHLSPPRSISYQTHFLASLRSYFFWSMLCHLLVLELVIHLSFSF